MGEVYPCRPPSARVYLLLAFARVLLPREDVLRELELLARVCAAFFAARLRSLALRLRVAAAFLAASLRLLLLVPPPRPTRLSSSETRSRSSLTARLAPLLGGELSARPNALARFSAALLRSPRARSVSNRSRSVLAMPIFPLVSGWFSSPSRYSPTWDIGNRRVWGMHVVTCRASGSTPRTSRL